MKFNIRVVQDEDQNDIVFKYSDIQLDEQLAKSGDTNAQTRLTRGKQIREWAKNGIKALEMDPTLPLLLQHGAILEVPDDNRHFIGLQIAGINGNKKKNDKRRCRGFISVGIGDKFSKKTISCCFDVRLVKTGVPG